MSKVRKVAREIDPQIYRFEGQRTYYLAYEIHDPAMDYEFREEIEFTPDDLTPRGVWMTVSTGVFGGPAEDDPELAEFYTGEDGLREFFRRNGLSDGEAIAILDRILAEYSEFKEILGVELDA